MIDRKAWKRQISHCQHGVVSRFRVEGKPGLMCQVCKVVIWWHPQ